MKKVFWGVFFLLAAAAVILSQIGDFHTLGLSTILITVVLLAIIVQSISQKSFEGVFVPLAILYWAYQKPFELPFIHLWVLILTGVFVTIGLSFIFKRKSWFGCDNIVSGVFINDNDSSKVSGDENNPVVTVRFGATTKYLRSDALESARVDVSFGAAEIYFQDVTLHPNGADVYLNCSFSGVELYIPRAWNIENGVNATLGAVDDHGSFGNGGPDVQTIRLHGNISLGAIEIKRV